MSRKIATLWDKKDDDSEHDHHQPQGQAFYAGGSEHSGQQILGPNRDESDNLVENLFQHARRSAALVGDRSDTHSGGGTSLPITFWRNGFTVGEDNVLRDYSAPENRQLLECLKRGETPPELINRVRGGTIDVKLENKAGQDYKPPEKVTPFSGKGYRLGAPAPPTTDDSKPSGSS